MSTAAEWAADSTSASVMPLFGARQQWLGYAAETMGFGSVELCGSLAHRVTIVHPDDHETLRRHHGLVRSGRLQPAWYRRRLEPSRLLVIDREELARHRADADGSWLVAARRVARLCGADDEVAQIAGPALRQLLWLSRDHLDSPDVTAAFTDLRRAIVDLATERDRYRAAVDRWVRSGERAADETQIDLHQVRELARADLETIRLESRVLAEVRREWTAPAEQDDVVVAPNVDARGRRL